MRNYEKSRRFEVVQLLDCFATVDYEQRVFRPGIYSEYGPFVRIYPRRSGRQWRKALVEDAMDYLRGVTA